MKTLDYAYLKENNLIIFHAIRGSFAYGTFIEGKSDLDYVYVYLQSLEDILGNNYCPQVSDEKGDCVGYEIRRYLELLQQNNPNILETIGCNDDCILYKHPIFDIILKEKEKFLTKRCADSFGKYAISQLRKAKGMDKMQNLEKEKVKRKTPLDFCYVIDGYDSSLILDFLKESGMEQKFCGISVVPNVRDTYALFYDQTSFNCFSESIPIEQRNNLKETLKQEGSPFGFGYKGIEKENEEDNTPASNSLRLSSIPQGEKCLANFYYNKDGYTMHCKKYRQYQEWLEDRNVQRWVDVKSHGQKIGENPIDGKNMLHCKRLLNMALEIAKGKGVIVRRPDAQELLKIRHGEVSLEELLNWAENEVKQLEELFAKSDLPDDVNPEFINELLVKIRKEFYNLK